LEYVIQFKSQEIIAWKILGTLLSQVLNKRLFWRLISDWRTMAVFLLERVLKPFVQNQVEKIGNVSIRLIKNLFRYFETN